MSPRRAAALIAASLLPLGACRSESTASSAGTARATPGTTAPAPTASTSTATEAAAGAAGPPCTVVTAALVTEKLGVALTGPNVDRGPAATICTYDSSPGQPGSATVQLSYQATPASFARGRNGFATHGEQVSDVAGLGDEAYAAGLAVANVTNSTLVTRKGSLEVLVTTTAPAGRLPALAAAILALV